MRFLLDESVEARIAGFLTRTGHDALRIGWDYPAGLSDDRVLDLAFQDNRILIANDKDFGELAVRHKAPHAGVILFRFPLDATADEKTRALQDLLVASPDKLDRFIVLTPHGSRIR